MQCVHSHSRKQPNMPLDIGHMPSDNESDISASTYSLKGARREREGAAGAKGKSKDEKREGEGLKEHVSDEKRSNAMSRYRLVQFVRSVDIQTP